MGYTLKQRDVTKLDAIAKKLGKSYTECFAEIVGQVHERMFGSAEEQHTAPKEPTNGKSRKSDDVQEALGQVGEPDDGHVLEDSSNEHQDAPGATGEPNPLGIKRWASTTDDDEKEERQRSVAKQRQTLARGKAQR